MIEFHNENIKFTLKKKPELKAWITSVIVKRKKNPGDICFIFCSDEYLLNINKEYLDHDTYTDIITFDYTKEDPKQAISGDIFISVDSVKENAKTFSKTLENELQRVMIHGVLHLLGYTDKTKKAKEEMSKEEDRCLRILSKK